MAYSWSRIAAGLVAGPPDGEAGERLQACLLAHGLALVVADELHVQALAAELRGLRPRQGGFVRGRRSRCAGRPASSMPAVLAPKTSAAPLSVYMLSGADLGLAAKVVAGSAPASAAMAMQNQGPASHVVLQRVVTPSRSGCSRP